MTRGGKRFYITFIDDCSRYIKSVSFKNKDETRDAFIKYKKEVDNQLRASPTTLNKIATQNIFKY